MRSSWQFVGAGKGDDAGFVLIEAVVGVAILAVCAGAALAAVASVTHATARTLATPALTLSAQNVLTDLRAATAYDPVQLAALAGRSISFDAAEPASTGGSRRVHIVASVTRSPASGAYAGFVTASAPDGSAASVQATLVQEAPAPGSVIAAGVSPDSARATLDVPAAGGGASGPIPL